MGKVKMKNKKTDIIIYGLVLLLIIGGCMYILDFSFFKFVVSVPAFFQFLFRSFLPPDLGKLPRYFDAIMSTVYAAIVSTTISASIAFILSFVVADKTTPHKAISVDIRSILSLFRNVPTMVWAAVLTIVFGIGITAGIIALIIFSVAFLTRVLSDAIDETDNGIIEAMMSVGSTRFEIIIHGIIPTFIPTCYSWILFMLEVGIKSSAVLGLVGAGGIGYDLKKNLDLFHYREASALILILVIMLLAIENVSNRIRGRLI